jgi:hypothetical protein
MEDSVVEVQVDEEPGIWYQGYMVDVNPKGRISVKFEDDVWPQREFATSSVRRSTPAPTDFEPKEGDTVEVKLGAVVGQPPSWATGTVKQERSGFYFVALTSGKSGRQQDMILEKDALRPVSVAKPLNLTAFERVLVPVEPELHKWVQSQDAGGCFEQVLNKALVSHVACDSSGAAPVVVVLGETRAAHRAKLLMEVHFKHQKEIQRFHDRREDKLREIEKKKQLYALSYREEFTVDDDIVGLVIGAKGENLRKVQAEHNVDIHVDRYDGTAATDGGIRKVKIVGHSAESVQAARAAVEYIKEFYPVEESMVGWMLGKMRKNLVEFQEKTQITRLKWLPDRSAIELCGLKPQIDDTLMLLDGHSQYYTVYKEMGREQENINESFGELGKMGKGGFKGRPKGGKDEKEEKGKGKGKDDGKPKGKGKGKDESGREAPDMGAENFPDLAKNGKSKGRGKR